MAFPKSLFAVDVGRLLKLDLGLGRPAGGGTAIEVVSVREGTMRIVAAGEDHGVLCSAAIIRPHQSFAIRDVTSLLARVFIEPDSDRGRRIGLEIEREPPHGSATWAKLGRQLVDQTAWRDFDDERFSDGVTKLLSRVVTRERSPDTWDPAVQRLMAELERSLPESPTLPMLSGRIGIDVERLRHFVGRDIGMSVGRFVEWFRLQRFAANLADGDAWQLAAESAGFKHRRRVVAIVNRNFGFTEADFTCEWATLDDRGRRVAAAAPPRRTLSSRRWVGGYPHLVAEWHPTKNGTLLPDEVSHGSHVYVWWRCPNGPDHEWRARVNTRVRGHNCPFCAGRSVSVTNCLAMRAPEIARQWHPTRNGTLTPADVVWSGTTMAWWRCEQGPDHQWQARVNQRTSSGSGCPFCANLRVSATNSLATLAPKLAAEWHRRRNGSLDPGAVVAYSTRLVWWQCAVETDHVWRETPNVRLSHARGCPFCDGKRVASSNSLATRAPEIAAEWHPTKNGELSPSNVTPGSHRVAWWRCRNDVAHEWRAMILNRTRDHARRGSGCPYCARAARSSG